MFDNPGGSLKKIGGVIFGIGCILSIIGGIWMFNLAGEASRSYYAQDASGGFVFGGILIIVVGFIVSYLLSIFIVAFGELVENSTAIRYMIGNKHSSPSPSAPIPADQKTVASASVYNKLPEKICPVCKHINPANVYSCEECGMGL